MPAGYFSHEFVPQKIVLNGSCKIKDQSFPFPLRALGDTQPQHFVVYQTLQNSQRGICLMLSLSRLIGTKPN